MRWLVDSRFVKAEMAIGLVYAVIFEKKSEEQFIDVEETDLPYTTYTLQREVQHFPSEIGSNPNLLLATFTLCVDLDDYTKQVFNIDWKKMPSVRMLISIEKGRWAGRLLSI